MPCRDVTPLLSRHLAGNAGARPSERAGECPFPWAMTASIRGFDGRLAGPPAWAPRGGIRVALPTPFTPFLVHHVGLARGRKATSGFRAGDGDGAWRGRNLRLMVELDDFSALLDILYFHPFRCLSENLRANAANFGPVDLHAPACDQPCRGGEPLDPSPRCCALLGRHRARGGALHFCDRKRADHLRF